MTDETDDLRWTDRGGGRWTATTPDGTEWEIERRGQTFAITIAHWDRPDWWADSLDAAKRLVAEVVARPPAWERGQASEAWVPGNAHDAYPTSADPPAGPCSCGETTPPEAVKPAFATADWWEDPAAFWRCPACGAGRGDVDYPV